MEPRSQPALARLLYARRARGDAPFLFLILYFRKMETERERERMGFCAWAQSLKQQGCGKEADRFRRFNKTSEKQ